uniref:SCO-spondin n=1 Tax=Branchiostoma floridae TaxID=7739 RepID=C3Z3K1_BRAFL|eukprot:XP_002596753.1 hypothetical protein BRAFLDRAFT_73747 [Branchiostoma floridae]
MTDGQLMGRTRGVGLLLCLSALLIIASAAAHGEDDDWNVDGVHVCNTTVVTIVEEILVPKQESSAPCEQVADLKEEGWDLDLDKMALHHNGTVEAVLYSMTEDATCHIMKPPVTHDVEVLSYEIGCCTGWAGVNCTEPVCHDPCQNGGTCSGPNVCHCPIGHFGNQCQLDVFSILDGAATDCADVADVGHFCDQYPSRKANAEIICNKLLEDPFSSCNFVIDPSQYFDMCTYDYCSWPEEEDRVKAVCGTMAAYSRECAESGVVFNWRSDDLCGLILKRLGEFMFLDSALGVRVKWDVGPTVYVTSTMENVDKTQGLCGVYNYDVSGKSCYNGTVYTECGSQCPRTCTDMQFSLESSYCSAECAPGCECPNEMVLDGDVCVIPESCPCYHHRERYEAGETIMQECNECVCHTGLWTCTEDRCASTCHFMGTGHVKTFDGKHFNIQGADCPYVLVEDVAGIKFRVTTKLQPCSSGSITTCMDSLTIQTYKDNVKLMANGLVYLNGELQRLPYRSTDLYLKRASSLYTVVEGFGVTVIWGSLNEVYVVLDPYYTAQVLGLCGTFNWDQHDDFTTRDGDVESAENTFTDRLRLTLSCPDVIEEYVSAYGVYFQNRAYSQEKCGILNSEVFAPCHDHVDKTTYYDLCLDDVSGCPWIDDPGNCLCPVLSAYAMACAKEGVEVDWRLQEEVSALCYKQCSGGQTYHECLDPCMRTCGDHRHDELCADLHDVGCVAGCNCPEGQLLDDEGRCVHLEDCTCVDMYTGEVYPPGKRIKQGCKVCMCEGKHWSCTRDKCAGMCHASGDPHYVTFDGRAYSFQGDCSYVLAKEAVNNSFTVTAENVPCGSSGVTCTKSVTVTIKGTDILMVHPVFSASTLVSTGRVVRVNGVVVNLPKYYEGSGIYIREAGMFAILKAKLGLEVKFDGGTRVFIRVEPQYQNCMAGLCGNYDGFQDNDFTTRAGSSETSPTIFGNSWRVSQACGELAEGDDIKPCELNPMKLPWAELTCSALMSAMFERCRQVVPYLQYYQWCLDDACGCDFGGDSKCVCTAISSYAEACNAAGIYVRWRSQELCPMQCDNGYIYEACGPICQSSCSGGQEEWYCQNSTCTEGCFCPDGWFPEGDSCVEARECPCFLYDVEYPAGAVYMVNCQTCNCTGGEWICTGELCEGEEGVGTCTPDEFTCSNARCVHMAWVCDGQNDCGDGTDETNCTMKTCSSVAFQCDNGQCIPQEYVCDGMPDCSDYTDEQACPAPTCTNREFKCENGRCIPQSFVCDAEFDCGFGDHSDEADCGDECGVGEFWCGIQSLCMPLTLRCDGHDDCGDGSDEALCSCLPHEFTCANGYCILRTKLCDSVEDCPRGVDENINICPSNGTGGYTVWYPWEPCSASCGDGTQTRHRYCADPQPLPDDPLRACKGEDSEQRPCYIEACPAPPSWGPWGTWSNWTGGCLVGFTYRERRCRTNYQTGDEECEDVPDADTTYLEIMTQNVSQDCGPESCRDKQEYRDRDSCLVCPPSCLGLADGAECVPEPCEADGYYEDNGDCVHVEDCQCYHNGSLYSPGAELLIRPCETW